MQMARICGNKMGMEEHNLNLGLPMHVPWGTISSWGVHIQWCAA
jgi:hypothetical protein